MNMAFTITISVFISLLFGYLIGSISNGVLIGKIFFHIDVRELGSHNAGGTNTGRVLGKKYGLLTIILDILKTLIAMWGIYFFFKIPSINNFGVIDPSYYAYISAIGACLGHAFPVFFSFKGGKAVACMFGIFFATNWALALLALGVFAIFFFTTKYVSVGSMSAGIFAAIITFIPTFLSSTMNFGMIDDLYFSLLLVAVAIYVILRHHSNINRLIHGTENKAKWLSKKESNNSEKKE